MKICGCSVNIILNLLFYRCVKMIPTLRTQLKKRLLSLNHLVGNWGGGEGGSEDVTGA